MTTLREILLAVALVAIVLVASTHDLRVPQCLPGIGRVCR